MYKFKIDWDGYYQAQRCMFLEWLQMVGHIPPYYWQTFFFSRIEFNDYQAVRGKR